MILHYFFLLSTKTILNIVTKKSFLRYIIRMRRIETSLAELKNLKASSAFRENAKRRLYVKMSPGRELFIIRLLKNIFKPIADIQFRQESRMRLESRIENYVAIPFYKRLFFYKRPLVSFVLTLCLLFLMATPQTEAVDRNEIVVSKGTVEIKSLGGEWQKIEHSALLSPGDQVRTLSSSAAEMYISGNSVIRISENTRLGVSFLSEESKQLISELSPLVFKLQSGKMWANIASKSKNIPFFIETKDSRLSTDYGVFDLHAADNVFIRSIQNEVKVETRGSNKKPILIEAGYQSLFSQNLDSTSITPIEFSNLSEWLKANQQKDKAFFEEVKIRKKEEVKKRAGILPTSPLYQVSQVVDSFSLKPLEKIEKDFAASKILYEEGQVQDALSLFEKSKDDLAKLWITQSQSEEILDFIDLEKDFFSQVNPSDPLFTFKKNFEDLFVFYASNPEAERFRMLSEKIKETKDLSLRDNVGEEVLVASLENFLSYQDQLLSESNTEEKEDLKKLLTIQNKNLEELKLIEKNQDSKEIKKKTSLVKTKLINSIEQIVAKLAPEKKESHLVNTNEAEWFVAQINTIKEKVEIYETQRGRTNTVIWLLSQIENKKENLSFLFALKEALSPDVRFPVTKKILQIRQGK